MPKPVSQVVLDAQNLLNGKGLDLVTLAWPEFYELSDRERMKKEFMLDLSKKLKAASLLVAYGNATVILAKDYRFAPLPRKLESNHESRHPPTSTRHLGNPSRFSRRSVVWQNRPVRGGGCCGSSASLP